VGSYWGGDDGFGKISKGGLIASRVERDKGQPEQGVITGLFRLVEDGGRPSCASEGSGIVMKGQT
jgi:hypothetical protein